MNLTAYNFTNRAIRFNSLWNICTTKSGKLISEGGDGVPNKKEGVQQKIQKLISGGGLLFGTGE